MERNQAISVAVGVGAVGTALAYLAYSYANTEDDTANIKDNTKENSSWFNNLFENSNTEKEIDVKQYEKLFEMDGITLRFEEEALEKIVEMIQEKAMGARGLRAVLETAMFDIMYEVPAQEDIKECITTNKAAALQAEDRIKKIGDLKSFYLPYKKSFNVRSVK